jgi:hypothetical protein
LGAADAPGQDFETRVDLAIERGVQYVRREMERDPWSGRRDQDIMGRAAIEVYALVKSDVSVNDPVVLKAIEFLNGTGPVRTYSVALYLMALEAALSQIETDMALVRGRPDEQAQASGTFANQIRKRMADMTQWLLSMRREGAGVWDYQKSTNRFDNSNTQFAVLALGVAAKRKLKVPTEVWEEIANHFLSTQNPDGPKVDVDVTFRRDQPQSKGKTGVAERHVGEEKPPEVRARGWGYQEKGETMTMTSAGLSSMILAREYLFRSKGYPASQRQRINQSIWDGTAWLVRQGINYQPPVWFYYAMYSVEKVGDLGAMEKIGGIDWYRQGADLLLGKQQADGSWAETNDHDHNKRYQTSFALLFLNRATDLLMHSRPFFTTGKGSSNEVREGWVYVRRIGGEVAVARLFRKLRYNPQAALLRIGEDVVKDAISLNRPHVLVPHLIDVCASPYRNVADFGRKGLERITGEKYDDPKGYREWAKLWDFVTQTALKRDTAAVGRLRELLRDSKSLPLKRQILTALEQVRAYEAAGDIIAQLEDADADYRARAYSALKYITFKDLPFTPNGPESTRKAQVDAWRQWFATNPTRPG